MGHVVAVIPARGGSKRLPRKNVHPVLGLPMLAWVVRACRESRHVTDVYVSTEDDEIARVAREHGAAVVPRPAELAADDVFKQDVVAHAVDRLRRDGMEMELVISVQPNSPELRGEMLDAAIEKLRTLGLWEVFSVDPDLVQNGAFRVMRPAVASQRALSVHCGVIIADVVDIHTHEDVAQAERRLRLAGRASHVPDR